MCPQKYVKYRRKCIYQIYFVLFKEMLALEVGNQIDFCVGLKCQQKCLYVQGLISLLTGSTFLGLFVSNILLAGKRVKQLEKQ